MKSTLPIRDLVILVADSQMKAALEAILSRHKSLSIHPVIFDIFVHSGRDPGVYVKGGNFLSAFACQYQYAMVMLDLEWQGSSGDCRAMANKIQQDLDRNGWQNRSRVIVIAPELDIWVWSDSPQVSRLLQMSWPRIKAIAKARDIWSVGSLKPHRPKELLEAVLRQAHVHRSASLYNKLSSTVSFNRCIDPAFIELKSTLKTWFPCGGNLGSGSLS